MFQGQDFHELIRSAPIPFHEISTTGEVVFVNAAECRLLDLTEAQILGRPVWDFVAPEELTASREAVRRKMSGEQPLAIFERELIRHDGARLIVEIHESHVSDEVGNIVGIRSFLVDRTQRRRTEHALQESERRLRHLIEHASDIIYTTDIHGRFVTFNSVATTLLGYPPTELSGRLYLDLIRPDFRHQVRQFYRRQLVGRVSHSYLEFPAITRDGREIWFGQNVELIDDNGLVTGFQAITRDISRRHRAEESQTQTREALERGVRERTAELEHANELLRREIQERQRAEEERRSLEAKLQHAQRLESLGVLAGGIAHDFNNLLTAIMGYASLALPQLPVDCRAHACIAEVVSAATSAAELTQQMLAYSGRGNFVIEPISLSRLIEDVSRLASTLISKKASIRLDLAPDLAPIQGDAAQLRQVLINLLTNASDSLGDSPGSIRITTGSVIAGEGELPSIGDDTAMPAGSYVYIEVADTGCGMDSDTLSRIFDPFFTTKFTGRGLGLAAVLGIVRRHNGTLRVHSEIGKGTTFRVVFPANTECEAQPSQREPVCDTEWQAEGVVLVVDDEPAIRSLASDILRSAGLTVMTAEDGNEAVRQFQSHSAEIRAVLLDLTMPGMDGGEVFQYIVRTKPDTKVILCSGYDVHDVNLKLGPHPAAGFLRKPYLPTKLIEVVRSVL